MCQTRPRADEFTIRGCQKKDREGEDKSDLRFAWGGAAQAASRNLLSNSHQRQHKQAHFIVPQGEATRFEGAAAERGAPVDQGGLEAGEKKEAESICIQHE